MWLSWEQSSITDPVLLFFRGVGCIFIEMIQGVAAFPGMKDIQDQLERIFLVSEGPSAWLVHLLQSAADFSLHLQQKSSWLFLQQSSFLALI